MSQPVEPTPGAPANQPSPTPVVPEPGHTTPTGPTTPEPAPQFDPSTLSPEAKAYLQEQIGKADLKARTTSKANAAKEAREAVLAEFAQKLGLAGDAPPDPAQLTEHLQQAQAQAWRSGIELNVYRVAGRLGGNADALLDSLSFIDSLDDLTDVDPRSEQFATQLEAKVQAAIERNPAYKANGQPAGPGTPRPDPSQGARGSGPTVDSRIAEAQAKGDWRTVISLQNEKLNLT